MIDLDELEKLALAATPGPWENRYERNDDSGEEAMIHAPNGGDSPVKRLVVGTAYYDGINLSIRENDADFIAHMNPARVLELVRRMRKLERIAEVAEVTRTLCDYDVKSGDEDDEHTEDCSACELDRQLAARDARKNGAT